MLLIITATPREMRSALSAFGALPPLRQGVVESWRVAGRDAGLLVTGVGLVNAALGLGRALAIPGLAGALNPGVAGAFDTRVLPPGSACVVRREIWPEYGLGPSDDSGGRTGADARALGFPLWGDRHREDAVWDRLDLDPDEAASVMALRLDPGWARTASLSVSGVTAAPERAEALRKRHGADLENMEGFALAYGCFRAGLPFLELRTVSNRVGSRAAEDWDLPGALAALGGAVAGLLG